MVPNFNDESFSIGSPVTFQKQTSSTTLKYNIMLLVFPFFNWINCLVNSYSYWTNEYLFSKQKISSEIIIVFWGIGIYYYHTPYFLLLRHHPWGGTQKTQGDIKLRPTEQLLEVYHPSGYLLVKTVYRDCWNQQAARCFTTGCSGGSMDGAWQGTTGEILSLFT